MNTKPHIGKCALCGQIKELTYEHFPPKGAFNSSRVNLYADDSAIELITGEKEFSDIKHTTILQKGHGAHCLCHDCNNYTGVWYMNEYCRFAKKISEILTYTINSPELPSFISCVIPDVYPLRVFKAILTMFCDINQGCFNDDNLRNYLLCKESTDLDFSRYSLYMYMTTGAKSKYSAIAYMWRDGEVVAFSELSTYPVGYILLIDKPPNFTPPGLCINSFAAAKYHDKCKIEAVGLPFLESESYFPLNLKDGKAVKIP